MSGHFAMLMDSRHSLNTLLRNVVGDAHGPAISPLEARRHKPVVDGAAAVHVKHVEGLPRFLQPQGLAHGHGLGHHHHRPLFLLLLAALGTPAPAVALTAAADAWEVALGRGAGPKRRVQTAVFLLVVLEHSAHLASPTRT